MSRFTATSVWDNRFFLKSNFFNYFSESYQFIKNKSIWPSVYDLQIEIEKRDIKTQSKQSLKPFNQDDIDQLQFPIDYENLIYEQGLILTRPNNWHDFFNAIVWLNFPKTKGLLNEWHYFENKIKQNKARTNLQNAISHFDECGMVILSDQPELFDLIKQHQWQEFFCKNKETVKNHIRCIVFGHSILERLLNPYVGLTSKCLFFNVNSQQLQQENTELLKYTDQFCYEYLVSNKKSFSSQILQPFPMLGMTEIVEKGNDGYINHQNYFRAKT